MHVCITDDDGDVHTIPKHYTTAILQFPSNLHLRISLDISRRPCSRVEEERQPLHTRTYSFWFRNARGIQDPQKIMITWEGFVAVRVNCSLTSRPCTSHTRAHKYVCYISAIPACYIRNGIGLGIWFTFQCTYKVVQNFITLKILIRNFWECGPVNWQAYRNLI